MITPLRYRAWIGLYEVNVALDEADLLTDYNVTIEIQVPERGPYKISYKFKWDDKRLPKGIYDFASDSWDLHAVAEMQALFDREVVMPYICLFAGGEPPIKARFEAL